MGTLAPRISMIRCRTYNFLYPETWLLNTDHFHLTDESSTMYCLNDKLWGLYCSRHNMPPPLQVVTWTTTQSDLVTLIFDFLTLKLLRKLRRGMDNRPANFWCFCDFSWSSYRQTRVKLTTWSYKHDLWPLRSSLMSVMWVILLHMCTKFEVHRPSHSEDMSDFWSRS